MRTIHQIPFAALGMGAAFTVLWGVADPVAAFAEVKTYTGVGKCAMGDLVSPEQAKNYAREIALQNAREQAGVYLTSYTRTTNTRLTENEIAAITNNITELVGDVSYTQVPGEVNGVPVVVYTATLQANVDTEGIRKYLEKAETDRVAIVRQDETVQKDLKDSLTRIEKLNEQYQRAESEEKKEQISREYSEADRKLLAVQKMEEGNARYYKGDYQGAIAAFDEALSLDPKYSSAYNNRSCAYSKLGRYDRAIEDCNEALAIDAKDAVAYYNRGGLYYDKGDNERAIADYDKAISLNSKYFEAYNNRGNAYAHKGNYTHAISDYSRALVLNPDFSIAYYNRGSAYVDTGEYDRAIADFDRALALSPKDADVYNGRGLAYDGKGDIDRAIADYSQALALDPKHVKAYINRGNAYLHKGDNDSGIADYNAALAIDPGAPDAYYDRALAYARNGDYGQAMADCRKALELNPDDANAKVLMQRIEEAESGD